MQLIVDDFRKVNRKVKLPYPDMTEEEFFDFCAANPEIPVERCAWSYRTERNPI